LSLVNFAGVDLSSCAVAPGRQRDTTSFDRSQQPAIIAAYKWIVQHPGRPCPPDTDLVALTITRCKEHAMSYIPSSRASTCRGTPVIMEKPDGSPWIESLFDGSQVLIRPLREDDREREEYFLHRLTPDSHRLRFLGGFKEASPELIKQLMGVDYARQVAFVALAREKGKLREVGVSRYGATDEQGHCECAVTVADDWRQRGLGVLLMRHLIDLARKQGYKKMISLDDNDNEAMRDLASYLGFHRRLDPGDSSQVIHTLDL
jgi:GNAT superfamily N-acetyltransferase